MWSRKLALILAGQAVVFDDSDPWGPYVVDDAVGALHLAAERPDHQIVLAAEFDDRELAWVLRRKPE